MWLYQSTPDRVQLPTDRMAQQRKMKKSEMDVSRDSSPARMRNINQKKTRDQDRATLNSEKYGIKTQKARSKKG